MLLTRLHPIERLSASRHGEDNSSGYTYVKIAMHKTDPRSSHDNWIPKHRLL